MKFEIFQAVFHLKFRDRLRTLGKWTIPLSKHNFENSVSLGFSFHAVQSFINKKIPNPGWSCSRYPILLILLLALLLSSGCSMSRLTRSRLPVVTYFSGVFQASFLLLLTIQRQRQWDCAL